MGVTVHCCVVSPHLLVAQAVAAALRSVGTPAEALAWETDDPTGPPIDSLSGPGAHLVVITDGLDNPAVIEAVERCLTEDGARVLVITSAEAAVRWGGQLESEALDVVTMTMSVAQLASAVDRMREGLSAMDPERRTALRAAWSRNVDQQERLDALMATLSPQQHRVLELLATGRRVSEVGAALGVAHGTVRSHVKALRAKLGAPTQLKAVAMYHQATDQTSDPPPGRARRRASGHESGQEMPVDLVPGPRRVGSEPVSAAPR